MVQSEKYNIILIEPSPIIQQGIKAILSSDSRFIITHTFSDIQTFENSYLKETFRIVLINPGIIGSYNHFLVKNLFPKYSDTIFIALLYNYISPETLESFDGTIDIYHTATQFSKKIMKIIENKNDDKNKQISDNVGLSDREKEILISVAIGLTNKEIAEKHNISVHTVMSHRKNISRKIGIKSVSGLTIYAIFNNLITESDIE